MLVVALTLAALASTPILARTAHSDPRGHDADAVQQSAEEAKPAPAPSPQAPVLIPAEPDPAKEEQAKTVAAFKVKAREMLADRNYDSATTAHFAVRTDDPRLETRETADLLESFGAFFDQFWSSRTDLLPWEGQAEVLLFYSRYKYDRLYEEPGAPTSSNSVGHYIPYFGVIIAHTDTELPGDFPGLLIHETAHQLTHQRLFGPEPEHLSIWIAEGLGCYFGFTRIDKKGGFEAGEIGGAVPALFRDHPSAATFAPGKLLSEFKRLLRVTDPGFIDDLVRTETQELFHVEQEGPKYVASWLLVHYMLHGEEGALAGPFVRYIKADLEGKGGAEVLYEMTGKNAETLEAGFLEYVKKLKAR